MDPGMIPNYIGWVFDPKSESVLGVRKSMKAAFTLLPAADNLMDISFLNAAYHNSPTKAITTF